MMLKVCLTHDIDRVKKTHQFVTKTIMGMWNLRGSHILNQLKSLFVKDNYWNFNEFINIEEHYGIKSTIFFLNETIKLNLFKISSYKLALGRYKIESSEIVEIIKWLDNNGWEIGVHGSYNSYNNLELLSHEKKVLENIVGHKIIGIRQHYLNLNENTWKYQKQVGFKYDSSLGFKNRIGFKDYIYTPIRPFNNGFLVFPLILMDTCFMNSFNKWDEFDEILNICEQKNAILVINFHQHIFNKYDFPGYKEAYDQIIQKCLIRGCKFYTLGEIYHHYSTYN